VTPDVEAALLDGLDVLDSLGLRHAVVGGLAVSAWAIPRATRDVDLYADLPLSARDQLQARLEARGFHVPAMSEELATFGVFRSRATKSGTFLDIFDAVGPLGDQILSRRRRAVLAGRSLWLVAPEDLVLLKAFSERARDFEDLVALFRHAGRAIEDPYVDHWAHQLDVSIGGDDVSERIRQARRLAKRAV
jgi:predicted nucleotidyltransferase